MSEKKSALAPCPECTYTEPTRANCKDCFERLYENGEITDEDIQGFGTVFIEEINKGLGIEDEYRHSTGTKIYTVNTKDEKDLYVE